MNIVLKVLIYLICTYFFSGIPFAYVLTKAFMKKDIRQIGSGNVGATNVYRAGGLKLAIPVFLLDFLKGLVPALLSIYIFDRDPNITAIVVAVAILGHILSPYLKFHGGKGAATSFGAMVILLPVPVAATVVIFTIIVALTRVVALGTIASAIAVPILYFLSGRVLHLNVPFEFSWFVMALITVIAAFIIFKHKSNIQRLMKGEENKI